MALTIKEEIEKRCNEDPELKKAWEEKKRLTVEDLLEKLSAVSGQEFANDRALLS